MATTPSKQDRDELIDVERLAARSGNLHVCAECKYAQLFAVQPRAVRTCQGSARAGRRSSSSRCRTRSRTSATHGIARCVTSEKQPLLQSSPAKDP